MIRRLLWLFYTISILLLFNVPGALGEGFEHFLNKNRFDQYFQHYSQKYFGPHFDWRYFKAQAIAESRLRPKARSSNGALGLMQILPSTFREIIQKNANIQGKITDPRSNIAAGIYYNKILWAVWCADRSFKDKLSFMFASYNAGKHTILQAQKIAKEKGLNPYVWSSIAQTLPAVNGDGSRETLTYVNRIHKIKKVLHVDAQLQPVTSCPSAHAKHVIKPGSSLKPFSPEIAAGRADGFSLQIPSQAHWEPQTGIPRKTLNDYIASRR